MMRAASFKKVVLCHTNDFSPNVNDKIKMWVEANGGTFAKDLNTEVTHLVASKKAWKRYYPIVRQARRMRTIKIVNYDWLEDSLMKKPVKALPEGKYLYEQLKLKNFGKTRKASQMQSEDQLGEIPRKASVPRDKKIELTGVKYDEARKEFEEDLATTGFHPYVDSTNFVYIITLLRHDILKNRFEKYRLKVGRDPSTSSCDLLPGQKAILHLFQSPEPFSGAPVLAFKLPPGLKSSSHVHLAEPWAYCLQLYESDEQPHTYACYTQYTRPSVQKQVLELAPPGSTWEFAWAMFEKFFIRKVHVTWNKRPRNGTEINLDGEYRTELFQYQAPRIKEPEGLRESNEHVDEVGKSVIAYGNSHVIASDNDTIHTKVLQDDITTAVSAVATIHQLHASSANITYQPSTLAETAVPDTPVSG